MPTAIDQASPSVTTSAMPTDASATPTTPTEEGTSTTLLSDTYLSYTVLTSVTSTHRRRWQ